MSKEMYEDRERWRAQLHADALRYFDYGRKGRPIRTNEDAFRALFDAAPLEYDEAMASLLIILTFNGIPAWNGDGTSIIAQAITKLSATVAALTAENERMRQALIDVASYGYADTFIRDRARAALPSSRETTDGRTDPS